MRMPDVPANETAMAGLEVFYDEFLDSRILEFELMEVALNSRNFQEIMQFAHKWKGFSAPYGFGLLAQMAKDLEISAEAAELENCKQLLREVEFYLKKTKKKGDSK